MSGGAQRAPGQSDGKQRHRRRLLRVREPVAIVEQGLRDLAFLGFHDSSLVTQKLNCLPRCSWGIVVWRGAPGTQTCRSSLEAYEIPWIVVPYLFFVCSVSLVFAICSALLIFFFLLLMEDPGYTISQIIFSPFYLELSLAKRGYEQLYRWAARGEWRCKASKQVLATCSSVKMPLQQISVVPARETASNGRSSLGTNKEKSKEAEVRGRFQFARPEWECAFGRQWVGCGVGCGAAGALRSAPGCSWSAAGMCESSDRDGQIAVRRQGACFKSEITNWSKLQTAAGDFNIFV